MIVAIDKYCIDKIKEYEKENKTLNEYIYLFDKEPLDNLINTRLKCYNYEALKDYIDINLTDYKIDCRKKAKITDKDWNYLPKFKNNKFGIIVPNYNYGECLNKCLTSILNQTYQNFEIIFVDDCSTDNSVEIATQLLCKEHNGQHKVIPLKQKRFNGGARNEAYLHLSDDVDYVWYVDSDDWLYDNYCLEKINKKLQDNEDVLFISMAQFTGGKTIPCKEADYRDKYDAFQGWSGSCGKVIKKELATRPECLYNEGTLKEDKNQHCRICIYMKTFKCTKDIYYVWNRENPKSVTTLREKIYWGTSTIRQYADTMQLYLSEKGKDEEIDRLMKRRLALCEEEIKEGKDRQY